MNSKDFKSASPGRIVRTTRGYDAYLPGTLPRELPLNDQKLIRLLADAERMLGRLSGIGYLVPNPELLVRPYTRREAVASSRIEGTQASLSELLYFEASEENPKASDDVLEVASYVGALNHGLEALNDLPLSLRLIRQVHKRLMSGMRGGSPDKTLGEFRRSQNWIGGVTLSDATYVPPPPEHLIELLGDWETFLHDDKPEMPLLVECALMHYQFEAIHPFLDGNGRVGRLMITLFLCARQVLPQPLLYLSDFFEKYRQEYYRRLHAVTLEGDWNGWLKFFLLGVAAQADHAIESSRRIVDQREKYRQALQNSNASGNALKFIDFIFRHPYFSIGQSQEYLGCSYPTALNTVKGFIEMNIVKEITGKQRNRIYVAESLLKLIAENEPVYLPEQ
jgi:Fic family protein